MGNMCIEDKKQEANLNLKVFLKKFIFYLILFFRKKLLLAIL